MFVNFIYLFQIKLYKHIRSVLITYTSCLVLFFNLPASGMEAPTDQCRDDTKLLCLVTFFFFCSNQATSGY